MYLFLYLLILSFVNNNIHQKKNRRIKAAFKLFETNDENVVEFDKDEIISILQQNEYHSPEQSDSEDEFLTRNFDDKLFVHVYDRPWRSQKVNIILCVLCAYI